MTLPLLSRGVDARPAAPVRILHLGVGNFFRAHQAWYTDQASDAAQWGIAAFTGRSPAIADALTPQDGLYTLLTRGADGDEATVIASLSAVHAAADHAAWLGYWCSPALALVTLTITEAGYLRGPDGAVDHGDPRTAADVAALAAGDAPTTAPGRLIAGLAARRSAGLGPVTLVPCDNLPSNGRALRDVVTSLAGAVDASLVDWIAENVSFATTMVDRITPATTDEHRTAVSALLGRLDASPVPTEPFSEWIIQGEFPAGRPAWEDAGARLVPDVEPFEHRKLALLNGSHSLLAYAGSILGHETVADAIADPRCLAWIGDWWDAAVPRIDLPAAELIAYRAALLERYRNPRIRHLLAQIAYDGSQKLPIRTLPTVRAEVAAGRVAPGSLRPVAAWLLHLRGAGAPVHDVAAETVTALAAGDLRQAAARILAFLDAELGGREDVVEALLAATAELLD